MCSASGCTSGSIGGYGDAFNAATSGDFPTYTVALTLSIPIRNRSGQADQVRSELEYRQAEVFLPYRPGSEAQLAGALAKRIVARGLADSAFLDRFVGNRAELLAYLDGIDVAAACAASGIDPASRIVSWNWRSS